MRLCVSGILLLATLAGCATGPAAPAELHDPCPLITDDMLQRLAAGAPREPEELLGSISGRKECNVNLESGTSSLRGDLALVLSVDGVDIHDDKWQTSQCAKFNAKPTTDGPGDRSCLTVQAWADGEARIDGLAWIDDDYEVRVEYQVVEPHELPVGAEQDLRALLEAGVNALPTA